MKKQNTDKTKVKSIKTPEVSRFKENRMLQEMLQAFKQSEMQNYVSFSDYVKLHIQVQHSDEINEMANQMRIDHSIMEHFELGENEDLLD